MERNEQIAFILDELMQLDSKNRDRLLYICRTEFGLAGDLSESDLHGWPEEQLEMLYKIAQGMRMTREYVPDIVNAYASTHPLPSTVSFGRMSEKDKSLLESRKPLHHHYGMHDVPESIKRLYVLEEELGQQMDRELGLIMTKQKFQYHCTPPDFITFAHSGMDGIHFGFLTDFGTVRNLEEAYIAVASPMDFDGELWIVARNIRDFLRIVCTDRRVLINHFESGEAYSAYIQTHGHEEEQGDRRAAADRLKAVFDLAPIDDLAAYMQGLNRERIGSIRYRTLDSLGVISIDGSADATAKRVPYNPEREEELTAALDSGDRNIRLAAIRDMQHRKLIPFDKRLTRRCAKVLEKLGLIHEAHQLKGMEF